MNRRLPSQRALMTTPGTPVCRGAAGRALLFSICLAACDGDAPDATTVESREAVVELAIREVEGRDEYTFGRVSGTVADGRGRIYVADALANEVRVFGADGAFLYRIGRAGQGPGEFDSPCCLALRDDDRTLWVRDGGNARYLAFTLGDTAATCRIAVRMAHTDVNRWAPVGFDSAGNLIDIGTLARRGGEISRTPGVARYHLDTTGRVVSIDTIPGPPEDSVPVHLVGRSDGQRS